MIQSLTDHISRYVPLPPEDLALLQQHVLLRHVAKKKKICRPGDALTENYFVVAGCLRLYSKDGDNRERTIQFAMENWWMFHPKSIYSDTGSGFYIETVEATTLLVLTSESWDFLSARIPGLENYFRAIFQRAYNASLWRINHLFSYSGSERYHSFVRRYPSFVQRIPQYMLASFLGLTPEFISMIRAKKV